jgi:hypothetical protein
MIKNKDVATKVSKLMIEYSAKLNDSIIQVKEQCSEEEFEKYRKAVAYIMGEMLIRVMNPLYIENPELKPDDLYIPGLDK